MTDTSIGDTSKFAFEFGVTTLDNKLWESSLKIVLFMSFTVLVKMKDVFISLNKQLV